MKNVNVFWYIVIHVLRVLLKKYKIQLPVHLFLVVLHQLLHKQISFLQLFQNLIQHFLKKKNFPFLTDSPKLLHPLNSQNLLSLMKVFCQCSPIYHICEFLFVVFLHQLLHQQISFFTFQNFIPHFLKKRFSSQIFLF